VFAVLMQSDWSRVASASLTGLSSLYDVSTKSSMIMAMQLRDPLRPGLFSWTQ
jgi:hypothetical protein